MKHTATARGGVLLRRIEMLCWSLGLLCLLLCAVSVLPSPFLRAAAAARDASSTKSAGLQPAASGAPLGTLEIPSLHVTIPVVEDDDTQSLLHGLGHIRGTAMLGGLGTTALAGHRDTFLRPIRHIQPAMELRAVSPTGTYHYIVDSTEIVDPASVRVLDIRDKPELVLVTCYPFDYVGPAPRRFIVHAHLVSAAPDAQPVRGSR